MSDENILDSTPQGSKAEGQRCAVLTCDGKTQDDRLLCSHHYTVGSMDDETHKAIEKHQHDKAERAE